VERESLLRENRENHMGMRMKVGTFTDSPKSDKFRAASQKAWEKFKDFVDL